MALPTLTPEQRAEALAKAAAARSARARLKAELKDGSVTLAQVLERAKSDELVAKTKVEAVLVSLPGVGKVRAQQAMEQLGISPTRRLAGLGDNQRAALLERFGR